MRATTVSIPTAAATAMPGYLVAPDGPGPHPGLLIIHEIFGLTPELRGVAERMAAKGYVALVPDLYYRGGNRLLCVARAILAMRRGAGDAFADLEAARTWLNEQEEVASPRVGVMGLCMGGGFAILLAARSPFKAAGVWYGEVPRDLEDLRGICPTVASYGARDRPLRGHGERLVRHLEQLDVASDVAIYPEVGHAFAFPPVASTLVRGLSWAAGMNVGYDPAVATEAWSRVDAFFADHLAE